MVKKNLADYIRDIPDFPKPGIIFKDITTLLQDGPAFKKAIDLFVKEFEAEKIDAIIGIESRGFIFGSVLAYKLGIGFIPVRKKGKLPYKTRSVSYALEYGEDILEIHEDALQKGMRVLVVDDLLATGGTMAGVAALVQGFQAEIVGVAFLVELGFLNGREKLKGLPVTALIKY